MLIGLDLGGTNIRAGRIKDGQIEEMASVSLESKDDLQATLTQLKDVIQSINKEGVVGIGVGVPSVVDVEKGIVYDVVNIPSWKEVHLKEYLEKEFRIPVYVNNDVNCFVLGEKHFGAGGPFANVVGIALGTGIGSGLIIDHKLYAGGNCGAGEIAYLPYKDKHFEYYCSSEFFERLGTTARDAFLKAEKGDGAALSMWYEFGVHVGEAIKAMVYAYDPEAIILGGSISKAFRFFEASMLETMRDTYFPRSIERLKLLVSELEHVAVLGAAAQALQQIRS